MLSHSLARSLPTSTFTAYLRSSSPPRQPFTMQHLFAPHPQVTPAPRTFISQLHHTPSHHRFTSHLLSGLQLTPLSLTCLSSHLRMITSPHTVTWHLYVAPSHHSFAAHHPLTPWSHLHLIPPPKPFILHPHLAQPRLTPSLRTFPPHLHLNQYLLTPSPHTFTSAFASHFHLPHSPHTFTSRLHFVHSPYLYGPLSPHPSSTSYLRITSSTYI